MSIKGQTFSSDFLIACSIFLLVLTGLFYYWTYNTIQIEESREINDVAEKTYLVSQIWSREGFPEYWDASNVIDLGLQNDHRFNQTKLDSLNDMGYEKVKSLIGIDDYDFFLRFRDTKNNTLFNFGLFPSDARNVVKVRRIGILNRSVIFVETMVWR